MSSFLDELSMTSTVDFYGVFNCSLVNNSDTTVKDFTLCFNMLAPIEPVSNCSVGLTVGGYVELKPSKPTSLNVNDSWGFRFAYKASNHKPINLSWAPQGVFVKLVDGSNLEVLSEDLKFQNSPLAPVKEPNKNITLLDTLRLVPHPKYWKPSNSVCAIKHPLSAQWEDNEIINNAYRNAYTLGQRLSFDLLKKDPMSDSTVFSINLVITTRRQTTHSSYQLIITSDSIALEAGDESGLFYGLITLFQLDKMYHKLIPCGVIKDEPRFEWRGQHLDCARHFYSVDSLHRLLDLMALFKLNKFHWHGTDDEAFRFKFDCNPELAEATSMRGDGQLIPPLFGSGVKPTGGCYDVDDINAVVSFAKNNYIDVMPEIELPGHCLSLLRFNPNLRDKYDKSNEVSVQGYKNNTINPASPEVWAVIQPLIKEACQLFPGEYIHLGGDELPESSWSVSPLIEELKLQHKLSNNNDILAWFINKLSQNVLFNNKKTAAWQEAELGTHSESKTDKLLFAWQDLASGHELARKGAKVVLCPAEHLYFDMAQSSSSSDRGANWAGIVTLNDTVDWQIVPENESELEDNILGIQGQLWSEMITADKQMQAMLCPRILGLAESAWSSEKNRRTSQELLSIAVNNFRGLFDQIGWDHYRAEEFEQVIDNESNINEVTA